MFKVVDLFAGPGGLAEGFSAVRDEVGNRVFDIALSVEKEKSAFSTLRLRSFVRQFEHPPGAYYDYVRGDISREILIAAHPLEWSTACSETLQLELGGEGAGAVIDPLIDQIRKTSDDRAILVGGPPCQAYSLAGRARNRGKEDYVASEDHRHFLYREYIRILNRLNPVAFVMENVKGFLSASIDGENIFSKVLADLKSAGGSPDSYKIVPLTADDSRAGFANLLKSENYGIPQRRHRVILLGIRKDIADRFDAAGPAALLEPVGEVSCVADVLSSMPKLRSRLSRVADSDDMWRTTVNCAFLDAAEAALAEEDERMDDVARRLVDLAAEIRAAELSYPTCATTPSSVSGNSLADWLIDPALDCLPNHHARGHMGSDLARYAFAATFAQIFNRSPKAREFPEGLAPKHRNWASGKFNDRFRVQCFRDPATTITSHIAKDGHYFIHPDPLQCRSLTVREAARLQTFPDNYLFEGNRTDQYTQVGNAVPPLLAFKIANFAAYLIS